MDSLASSFVSLSLSRQSSSDYVIVPTPPTISQPLSPESLYWADDGPAFLEPPALSGMDVSAEVWAGMSKGQRRRYRKRANQQSGLPQPVRGEDELLEGMSKGQRRRFRKRINNQNHSQQPQTELQEEIWSQHSADNYIAMFFSREGSFVSGGLPSKLLFWQSLCIDFNLVQHPSSPNETHRPHPFPTTLTQAKALLKANVFVNLRDYVQHKQTVGAGRPVGQDGGVSGLMFESKAALKRYTKKNRRYANKSLVKSEWLDPLLVDMFFVGR